MILIQRVKGEDVDTIRKEVNAIISQLEEQVNRELQIIENRLTEKEQE